MVVMLNNVCRIAKLRQEIETDPAEPRLIVTLHRIGYKFFG